MRDPKDLDPKSTRLQPAIGEQPDWQKIVDAMDEAISVFDSRDRLTAWNQAFAETAGKPQIDLEYGMPHLDILEAFARRGLYGRGDPRTIAENRLKMLELQRTRNNPEEFYLANGTTITRNRYWLDNGDLVSVTRNVSQRKVVEQELEAKSALLQTLFETLGQPVCVWGADQRLLAFNDHFAEMMGLAPDEISIGMHAREFILASARNGYLGGGDPVELADARYHEMWDQPPLPHEVLHRAGGRTFDVHRGRLPDGGVVSIFNDVTERARTAEELHEAKAQAENANAVKSDFLANMSHELRTPLNAILGFAEMMIHTRFENPVRYQEYAGDIRDSAVLLLNIINDLLDLSRIEAGKTEFRLVTLDLNDCISTCMDLIQRTDGAQKLTFEKRLPMGFPQVQLDETFLRQALLNLLSNAVKATPDGGKITVAVEPNGDDRFNLTVADTGIGMPPEMLETVFNPYDGTGNSYVRKEKGTGLGLAIVKRLVEMLRGEVSIASTPGEGTTVRMDLPLSFTE